MRWDGRTQRMRREEEVVGRARASVCAMLEHHVGGVIFGHEVRSSDLSRSIDPDDRSID